MCLGAAAFPKLGWVSWLTAAPACAGSPSSAAPRCLFLPFANFCACTGDIFASQVDCLETP